LGDILFRKYFVFAACLAFGGWIGTLILNPDKPWGVDSETWNNDITVCQGISEQLSTAQSKLSRQVVEPVAGDYPSLPSPVFLRVYAFHDASEPVHAVANDIYREFESLATSGVHFDSASQALNKLNSVIDSYEGQFNSACDYVKDKNPS
jgi:hypothetical protein